MGYRANVVTRDREYGDQTFSNYQAFQRFFLPDNDEMSNYEGMTNRELANALRMAIEESPDRDVTWEWF